MWVSGQCQNRGNVGLTAMQIRCAAPIPANTPKAAPSAKPPESSEIRHVQLPAMKDKQSYKQFRRHGAKRTRVLKLRGGEELLFQFGDEDERGTAWRHGEHVGTVSVLQQWIAVKKLIRDDYDASKANHNYKMWEDSAAQLQASHSSTEADESEALSNGNGVASEHAQPNNSRLTYVVSPEKAREVEERLRNSRRSSDFHWTEESPVADDDDRTLWHQESTTEQQAYDALHDEFEPLESERRNNGFRAFGASNKQPEPLLDTSQAGNQATLKKKAANKAQQQAKQASKLQKGASIDPKLGAVNDPHSERRTYPQHGGWTVLNESMMPESGLVRQSEEFEEEGEDYSLEEQHDEAEEEQSVPLRSVEDLILRSTAEPEASSSSTAKAEQTGSTGMKACLRAAMQFFAFWRDRLAGLVSSARSLASTAVRAAQVAFWATLYLMRRAQWAVFGQPRPPKVHASPTVALLCECPDEEKARELSFQHGYDSSGKKADPLEDLPRWRVEKMVGTFVVDMSLYRLALTAPSAVRHSRAASSYERLEYLGDSILEGIARQFVYERWPDATEHAMCAMVSGLVSGRTLHDFARGLHMQRYLALGLEAQWSAKHLLGWADGILADCFEALLGALFLDRGYRAAKSFMLRAIEEFVKLERLPYNRDYKGILGNVLAIRRMGRPRYRCRLGTVPEGQAQKHLLVPDNGAGGGGDAVLWEAEVQVKGRGAAPMVLSRAYDIHRNTAEQQAARAALQSMGLKMQELNLVEADQITMKNIVGRMPGLTTLKDLDEAAGTPRKSGKGSQ